MRRSRSLVASAVLLVVTLVVPNARAANCTVANGSLAVAVGDGETAILLNDGTSVSVQGVPGCTASLATIGAGIVVTGSAGANTVEVHLHPTVPFPAITLRLLGGGDAVLVVGTAARDVLTIASRFAGPAGIGSFTVDAGDGNDAISASGWGGPVTLLGGAGMDGLIGSGDDDTLDGGAGDDSIAGRGGADAIVGGLGSDTADYAASSSGVRVTVNGKRDNVGGEATGDTLAGIEDVIGSAYADVLTGDRGVNALLGNLGDDVLDGRGGGDLLSGGSGEDAVSYAASPAGIEVQLGVSARGGYAGGDRLVGVEDLVGSAFEDRIQGNALPNRLDGGAGIDLIVGGDGADVVSGGAGADWLEGGAGEDTVSYERASAAVKVDLARGTATGGWGPDLLRSFEDVVGSAFADALIGGPGANVLVGGAGADTLSGAGGNDRLFGGDGADRLSGGDGEDLLNGGPGVDACDGGPALDAYLACDGTGSP